jgi:hypothetical protein
MWAVVCRDLKSVLRSPLIYAGTILIGIFLYFMLSIYFTICYVPQDMAYQELSYREIIELGADVQQGYIPASYTQNGNYQLGMSRLESELQGYLSLSVEETKQVMQEVEGMMCVWERLMRSMRIWRSLCRKSVIPSILDVRSATFWD